MEDYKEKYEQALNRAKTLYNSVFVNNDILEQIFPELEEGRDERIRKEIISFIKQKGHLPPNHRLTNELCDEMLAWLEKQKQWEPVESVSEEDNLYLMQDEQKPAWSEEDEEIIKGLNNCIDELEEKNGWCFTYVNDKSIELNKIRNWLKSIKQRLKV